MQNPAKILTISLVAAVAALTAPLASAQLATGLVAYWPFDGDLLDTSGTGAHGTAVLGSAAVPELFYSTGRIGDGVYLNGIGNGEQTNQYIVVGGVAEDTFDFTGGSMSVSFWVRSTWYLGGDNQTLIGKGDGDSWRLSFNGMEQTPAMFGGLGNTAAAGDVNNPDHALDGGLHHLVGVVEAGVGIRLYYDGALIASASGSPQLGDSSFPLYIGGNPAAAGEDFRFSEGIIDDLGIWNRPLTAGEISLLWNNGNGLSIGTAIDPTDTDNDGMPDFYEDIHGLNKNSDADAGQGADDGLFDNDGLTNLEEYNGTGIAGFPGGTDPNDADTDDDGLSDGEEVKATLNVFDTHPADGSADATDPGNPDSDGDGLSDGEEVKATLNTFDTHPVDGSPDATDPWVGDSDGDGATDREEIDLGFNPRDPASLPPPMQRGLRGYWPFENTLEDASGLGQGFDGTLLGTSTTISYRSGKLGRAILPEGRSPTNQAVQIGGDENAFDFPGGSMTVSAWVRLSIVSNEEPAIVAKGADSNWRLTLNPNGNEITWAGGSTPISGGGSISGPIWRHAVAVSEAGVATRLYVDGLLRAVGDAPNLGSNSSPMEIGGNPEVADRNWNGLIDEVGIWNRALDPGEIRLLWNDGTGASVSDLIAATDTDNDGMLDVYEDANGLDKNNPADAGQGADDGLFDNDGLTNLQEFELGSDPNNPDTDGDGLEDDAELAAGTNPAGPDTDGDGLDDGEELIPGLDGFVTDPLKKDTDGDGFNDGDEGFSDPTDPNSKPGLELDLVAYFPLDGNVLDMNLNNPNAHDGTFNGTMPASYVPAQLGTGIDLNGSNQDISIGGPEGDVEFIDQDFSVSIWFSIPNFSKDWQALIAKGEGDSWRIHRHSNQTFITLTGGPGANEIAAGDFSSMPVVTDNQMHHLVAIVEQGVSSRIWIDGELVGLRTSTPPDTGNNNDNPARIGNNPAQTGRFWEGRIDDVGIWGRVLKPVEVELLWNGGAGRTIEDAILNPPEGPADPVSITNIAFNGGAVDVTADGMDPAKTYHLRRSPDLQDFSTQVDAPFTGAAVHTFSDPSPPPGKAFYQIWTAGP